MQMFRTAPSETADGPRLRRVKRAMALLALACLTALIYLAALVATMPASALSDLATMPRQVTAFYGTIWQGRADLIDGYRIDWDHRPGDLLGLRLAADATLQGPDTLLRGTVRVTPWTISARDVTGRAGPGLLALADGLAIAGCSTRAIVDVPYIALARTWAAAEGRIDVEAGDCTETNGRIDPVPAMTLTLGTRSNDATGRLTTGDTLLAEASVKGDHRLTLTLQPAGSALIPGLPTGAPISLDYPF